VYLRNLIYSVSFGNQEFDQSKLNSLFEIVIITIPQLRKSDKKAIILTFLLKKF